MATEEEWRRLVEEARTERDRERLESDRQHARLCGEIEEAKAELADERKVSEHLRVGIQAYCDSENAMKAERDRLKGDATFLRGELTKCQALSESWGKERDRLKGELAEAITNAENDRACWRKANAELAEARRLLRTVASDSSPAMDAWDAECDAFLAATPAEQARAASWKVDLDEQALAQGVKPAGVLDAVWPTIHGLEQHYREVRGQVAALAKRMDALDGARGYTLLARVEALENGDMLDPPAPPPPEAAGPGHAFVDVGADGHCGHVMVDAIGWEILCGLLERDHAVPPIPEGGAR